MIYNMILPFGGISILMPINPFGSVYIFIPRWDSSSLGYNPLTARDILLNFHYSRVLHTNPTFSKIDSNFSLGVDDIVFFRIKYCFRHQC